MHEITAQAPHNRLQRPLIALRGCLRAPKHLTQSGTRHQELIQAVIEDLIKMEGSETQTRIKQH